MGEHQCITPRKVALSDELLRSYTVRRRVAAHDKRSRAVDYSADGTVLASATHDDLQLLDARSGVAAHRIHVPGGRVAAATFLRHDRVGDLVMGTRKELRTVNVETQQFKLRFVGHNANVMALAQARHTDASGGAVFASADLSGSVRVWERRVERAVNKLRPFGTCSGGLRMCYDPLGIVLFAASATHVHAYDVRRYGRPFLDFEVQSHQDDTPSTLTVSNCGRRLAIAFPDEERPAVWLYSAFDGALLNALEGHRNNNTLCLQTAFSADAQYAASGSTDGALHVWNVGTGQVVLRSPPIHPEPPTAVAFNPVFAQLATACKNIALWVPRTEDQDT